jgi:hypothetical protein
MSKSDLLLISVKRFYDIPENGQLLLDILHHKRGISLRNLEYFVTNYAKQTNLTYVKGGKPFTVHVAYKSSLDGYSKKLFDPFCRTERIKFRVMDQDIITTVAQLNFIRWCITNDIILQLGSKGKNNADHINRSCIDPNMNNLTYI